MVKHKHSKDRLFVTATEWREEFGGHKKQRRHGYQPLAFDCCALSLAPFEIPYCTRDGVVFDMENIVNWMKKHRKNPVTGEPMAMSDLIKLNMHKNSEGKWYCPATCKVFTNHSRICAIATTGNVFSYDAVETLNVKNKCFRDLLDDSAYTKSDIIMLNDPTDAAFMAARDINNFKHLRELREEAKHEGDTTEQDSSNKGSSHKTSNIRATSTMKTILREAQRQSETETSLTAPSKHKLLIAPMPTISARRDTHSHSWRHLGLKEFAPFEQLAERLQRKLKPSDSVITVSDLFPGREITSHRVTGSFTSTAMRLETSNREREATIDELREAKYQKMRDLGKKGYVQLQTSVGNINLEIHCDITPKTAENFIRLCDDKYYDGTVFHRLIKGFMIQGGDPTGTGSGGESFWGEPFRDEFDGRLKHTDVGVLSMANSGEHSNSSQFFITFRAARHLDYKHTVFGRVAGGMDVLRRMEELKVDKKDKPVEDISILAALVFVNPITEAEAAIIAELEPRIEARLARPTSVAVEPEKLVEPQLARKRKDVPLSLPSAPVAVGTPSVLAPKSSGVGKYLKRLVARKSTPAVDTLEQQEKRAKTAPSSFGNFSGW